MKLLIIEDDYNKRTRIVDFARTERPDSKITCALSKRSALQELLTREWDLVILDMTLPTFDVTNREDGFQTETFAGWQIMRDMTRKDRIFRTVIVTQFDYLGENDERVSLDELRLKLEREFPQIYSGTIHYVAGETNWMTELTKQLVR